MIRSKNCIKILIKNIKFYNNQIISYKNEKLENYYQLALEKYTILDKKLDEYKIFPVVCPKPLTILTTPFGKPHSYINSRALKAVKGVFSLGFTYFFFKNYYYYNTCITHCNTRSNFDYKCP